MLGGPTIGLHVYPPVSHFLHWICAKNYGSWFTADRDVAIKKGVDFGPLCRYMKNSGLEFIFL